MKANWILLGMAALVTVACGSSKSFEYTPPKIVVPEPQIDKDLLKDLDSIFACQEAKPAPISLTGPFERDSRVRILGDVTPQVKPYVNEKMTTVQERLEQYELEKQTKKELVNVGCSDEMAKSYAEGMDIVKWESGKPMIGEKVLLCGTFPEPSLLVIVAKQSVVMKDFKFIAAGVGGYIVSAAELRLEGKNELGVGSISGSIFAMSSNGGSMTISRSIEGEGSLQLQSILTTCADVKKAQEEKDAKK